MTYDWQDTAHVNLSNACTNIDELLEVMLVDRLGKQRKYGKKRIRAFGRAGGTYNVERCWDSGWCLAVQVCNAQNIDITTYWGSDSGRAESCLTLRNRDVVCREGKGAGEEAGDGEKGSE